MKNLKITNCNCHITPCLTKLSSFNRLIYENMKVEEISIKVYGTMQIKKEHDLLCFHTSNKLDHSIAEA